MNTSLKLSGLLCTALLCLATSRLHAQFDQINAGAESTNQNAKLAFANAGSFDAASGYAHTLVYTIVTNYSLTNVIYSSTNLQFWALSTTNTGGAAVGSHIVCEVLSVTGPAGGIFRFWEQGWRTPTFAFPVGASPTVGSNRFDVSDLAAGAGLPDGDPVGKIPTRRFTVDKPGSYLLTCKLYDTSTNTAAGGPKHTPSDPITIKFNTGLDLAITRIAQNTNVPGMFTMTFKQSALTNLMIEANTNLTVGYWATVGGPFTNAPAFNGTTTLSVTNPTIASQFYRLRGVAP